jgi:hypothetical protein
MALLLERSQKQKVEQKIHWSSIPKNKDWVMVTVMTIIYYT